MTRISAGDSELQGAADPTSLQSVGEVLGGKLPSASSPGPGGTFEAVLKRVQSSWEAVEVSQSSLRDDLPQGLGTFIEVQLSVNRISLETQLLSRLGESTAQTVRQLQQAGGH